jgi:2-iminobutanoate/2-iminopropanoate deaminase
VPKQIVYSPEVMTPTNPHAQAVVAGGFFYAATVAFDVEGRVVGIGDIEAQTRQALQNLVHLLEAAGGSVDDVARVMIYLTDMRHFEGMNRAYAEVFKGEALPSRATVTGVMGNPHLLVEFDVIAYLGPA